MESTKFGQVFKVPRLPAIKVNDKLMQQINEANKFNIHFRPAEDVTVGIEYEIENCRPLNQIPNDVNTWDAFCAFWQVTQDGSLRNNGAEFVSKPVTNSEIAAALSLLNHYLRNWVPRTTTSHRTGIHVHVNASDLNVPQIFAWVSLYQVFERMLYKYSGHRDENIYCLPTYAWADNIESAFRELYQNQGDALRLFSRKGHKYAGLNALPLEAQGTLEFRMMHTTHNIEQIGYWVDFLTHVKAYAASKVEDIDGLLKFLDGLATLNTSSKYGALMDAVFPVNNGELLYKDWERDIALGVIQVKENLVHLLQSKERPARAEPAHEPGFVDHRADNLADQQVLIMADGSRIPRGMVFVNQGIRREQHPHATMHLRRYRAQGELTQQQIREEMRVNLGGAYTPEAMARARLYFMRTARTIYYFE